MAKKKLKENTTKTEAGDGNVGQVVVVAAGAAATHHHSSSGQHANLQQQPAMERGKRPRDGDTEGVGANTTGSSADSSSAPVSDADDDAMPPTACGGANSNIGHHGAGAEHQDAVAVAVEDPLAQLGLIHEVDDEEEDDDDEGIQIVTNAEVAAEVDKAPLCVVDKHSLDQQRVHMVAAVGKVWMTLMHHWHNHLDRKIAVALLTGESSFGRKLAFLANVSMGPGVGYYNSHIGPMQYQLPLGFAPSSTTAFNARLTTHPMQSRAILGNANTVIEELKKYVATQPPGTFQVQDGRLVVNDVWVRMDEVFTHFFHLLYHSALLHQIDVVKALLQHVKLTNLPARQCFIWALSWKNTELGERRPVFPLVNMLVEMRIIEPEDQVRTAVIENHVEFVRKFGTPSSLGCQDYLYLAVSSGAVMVKVLLEQGADRHAISLNGRTALQLAQDQIPQNQEIIDMLQT